MSLYLVCDDDVDDIFVGTMSQIKIFMKGKIREYGRTGDHEMISPVDYYLSKHNVYKLSEHNKGKTISNMKPLDEEIIVKIVSSKTKMSRKSIRKKTRKLSLKKHKTRR